MMTRSRRSWRRSICRLMYGVSCLVYSKERVVYGGLRPGPQALEGRRAGGVLWCKSRPVGGRLFAMADKRKMPAS